MFNLFKKKKFKILNNFFKTTFEKRVLLSILTRPFLKGLHYKHNNQFESMEMAKIFNELNYQVDIINYDNPSKVPFSNYDVLFGAGAPFDNLFRQETTKLPRTIIYMCGAYPPLSSSASLQRLESVFQRRGVWLPGSARLSAGGIGTESVVDGLIVLGNAATADPFRALTRKPVHELPLFFHRMLEASEVLAARKLAEARKHFIWFAGSGLVHKGLDLVLEAFAAHPDLHLHVYGSIENEVPFLRAFHHELYELPNVHVEGFLALDSPEFRVALQNSAFIICPSCSEASASSVLNICGNGGNIPILTRMCAIELADFGILIGDTTVAAVEAALVEAAALSDQEVDRRLRSTAAYLQREHSMELYHQRLKQAIQSILAGPPAALPGAERP